MLTPRRLRSSLDCQPPGARGCACAKADGRFAKGVGAARSQTRLRQGPSRSKARQQPPQAQHSREGTASRELKPVIAGVVLKLAPGEPPRPPGAGRACARTYGGYARALRARTAPVASESPAQGRQFYADETLMPGDRRGATKSPPVHSRSRLLAIHSPRLAIT